MALFKPLDPDGLRNHWASKVCAAVNSLVVWAVFVYHALSSTDLCFSSTDQVPFNTGTDLSLANKGQPQFKS